MPVQLVGVATVSDTSGLRGVAEIRILECFKGLNE